MTAFQVRPSPSMGEGRVGVTRRFNPRFVLTRCHPHPQPFPHQRGKGEELP
jgi:hypothetical protein